MACPPRLSTPYIGNGLFDACMVNWRGWIEYACNVIPGANVRVSRGPAGNVINVDIPDQIVWAKVTTAASARPGASGTYSTNGVATVLEDPGSSPLVTPPVSTSVSFLNDHDKQVNVGATIKLWSRRNGTYVVFDVGSCTSDLT